MAASAFRNARKLHCRKQRSGREPSRESSRTSCMESLRARRAPTARGERIVSHRRHKRMDRLKSAVRGTLDLRLRVTSWFEAMPRSRQNAIVWSVALTLMIVVSAINPEPAYAQKIGRAHV